MKILIDYFLQLGQLNPQQIELVKSKAKSDTESEEKILGDGW